MKKLTLCILSTFLMLSVIPTQLKASTENNPSATTAIKSNESSTNLRINRLNEIKSIDLSALSTSENKETLKEVSPLKNNQDEHSRRYQNRHARRNVDVTVTSGHPRDGYYEGRHGHGGAYIGVGGVLILILILILIL